MIQECKQILLYKYQHLVALLTLENRLLFSLTERTEENNCSQWQLLNSKFFSE